MERHWAAYLSTSLRLSSRSLRQMLNEHWKRYQQLRHMNQTKLRRLSIRTIDKETDATHSCSSDKWQTSQSTHPPTLLILTLDLSISFCLSFSPPLSTYVCLSLSICLFLCLFLFFFFCLYVSVCLSLQLYAHIFRLYISPVLCLSLLRVCFSSSIETLWKNMRSIQVNNIYLYWVHVFPQCLTRWLTNKIVHIIVQFC